MKSILLFGLLALINAPIFSQKITHELPKLPYKYDALEPHLDAQTMEIHYSKHHQAYVNNLNKAIAGTKWDSIPMQKLLLRASRTGDAIRNNAGGHYNHSLFWSTLAPNVPFNPKSEVGKAIINDLGGLDSLKKHLNAAASSRFGSGWGWLYLTPDKKLAIASSPNQDNPIMDVSTARGIPIFGIDVWEHAYYLKFQNKRVDYLNSIWNVINWDVVNANYVKALNDPFLVTIERDAWIELKDFHKVMAQTFHPAEEKNFKPIRERSGEMLAKAQAVQKGKIPTSFDKPDMKKAIENLVAGSAALDKLVRKKSKDAKIFAELNRLHDTFHTIQGLCEH